MMVPSKLFRRRRWRFDLLIMAITIASTGCDMTSNASTDPTGALSTLVQGLIGFALEFGRQLLAAFLF